MRRRDRVDPPFLLPLPTPLVLSLSSRFSTLAKTLLRFKSVPFGKVPTLRLRILQKYFNDREIFLSRAGYIDSPFAARGHETRERRIPSWKLHRVYNTNPSSRRLYIREPTLAEGRNGTGRLLHSPVKEKRVARSAFNISKR